MPKRSSNPQDLNQLAARLVQKATSDEPQDEGVEAGKDPAAVEPDAARRIARLTLSRVLPA